MQTRIFLYHTTKVCSKLLRPKRWINSSDCLNMFRCDYECLVFGVYQLQCWLGRSHCLGWPLTCSPAQPQPTTSSISVLKLKNSRENVNNEKSGCKHVVTFARLGWSDIWDPMQWWIWAIAADCRQLVPQLLQQCTMHHILYALCIVLSALCTMHYALCTMLYALYMYYALLHTTLIPDLLH